MGKELLIFTEFIVSISSLGKDPLFWTPYLFLRFCG